MSISSIKQNKFIRFYTKSYYFQKIALDAEEFRLGIQKCRKTIENACKDENVFKVKGIETFFRLQQRKEDMRIGGVKGWGKGGD